MNNESPLGEYTSDYFEGAARGADTITAWIFNTLDWSWGNRVNADDLWLQACSQYDAEDQASVGDDDVYGNVDLKNHIGLFAPVQLFHQWSPLPHFGAVLGTPNRLDISRKGPIVVCVGWLRPKIHSVAAAAIAKDKWVNDLLVKGITADAAFTVVCFAGHSYKDRHLSEVARTALSIAGWPIVTRSFE